MAFDESLLGALRGVGDPPADDAMATILASRDVAAVNHLLGQLVDNTDIPADVRFPEVTAFLDATRALPHWVDPGRIRNAERVFARHGAMAYIALSCASLPECYYDRQIAEILGSTNRLEDDVHRRLFETAQLVIAVMAPGGLLEAEGSGVIACQKVRLMHAAIRLLVREQPDPGAGPAARVPDRLRALRWSEGARAPVDQLALAMTLQTFSAVVLRSLPVLGVELTRPERDDYVHAWNAVGSLMGVDERLLPETAADARELLDALKRDRQGPTQQGQDLTHSLLGFIQSLLPRYAATVPRSVARELLGDPMADDLGVERLGLLESAVHFSVIQALRVFNVKRGVLSGLFPGIGSAWDWLSRSLIDGLLEFEPGRQARAFRIPDRLSEQWGVGPNG